MDTAALVAEINKIPPVTRFLTGSTLAVSLPVMAKLINPYKILYHKDYILHKYEIWRLWTTFFYGGSGIPFLFDFVMLYRTSDNLESSHFENRSADYAWQLFLASVGLFALNQPLGTFILHRPFTAMLIYFSSRLSPNTMYSLFGVTSVKAKWWPYVMLAMDGMMGGKQAVAQCLTGMIAGHAWWLLFWRDEAARESTLGRAPAWLKSLIPPKPEPMGPPPETRTGPQPLGFGATRGPTARVQPTAPTGYNWGQGHRLGD